MEPVITVVGIGPGAPEYVPPVATRAIEAAAVLVGSRRALRTFARPGQLTFAVDADLAGAVAFIREHRAKGVAVLVSGDPGFYSLLTYLRRHFAREELSVIPGISSLQVAFARMKAPWHDAVLISLHGRDPGTLKAQLRREQKVAFLTDPANTPRAIARILRDELQWGNCRVVLCANLSYPDETVRETDLASLVYEDGGEHAVMVVWPDA